MPTRARRNCANARRGCRNLTTSRFCQSCARKDDRRVKAAQPWRWIYTDPRWEPARRAILDRDPVCRCDQSCCPDGCDQRSEIADHVTPARDLIAAGEDPFRLDKLQGLAKSCHDRKTARENRFGGSR